MAMTPVPSQVRKVQVYELANRTRLESLLVVTGLDSAEVVSRLRRAPPPEAAGWTLSDEVGIDALATHIAEPAAEQFLTLYLDRVARRTWRFRVWRP
jgi:hypothetical protein